MSKPVSITPEQKAEMVALANKLADSIDTMSEKQEKLETAELSLNYAARELREAVYAYINIKDALEALLPQKEQLPK